MQKGFVTGIALAFTAFSAATLFPASVSAADPSFVSPPINGYEEVPTRSTPAVASFRATVNDESIDYELTYSGFVTAVREAHIHLGRRRVNGGVMVFLCSNQGNAPANTPGCPTTSGTVTGTLTPAGVVGPADQGIAPGEFEEVVAAMRAGAGYVNIHTEQYPAGEIRNQVLPTRATTQSDDE